MSQGRSTGQSQAVPTVGTLSSRPRPLGLTYAGNYRVRDPQPVLLRPGVHSQAPWPPSQLTKLEPVHLLLPLVCCLLAPCLQLRQLL